MKQLVFTVTNDLTYDQRMIRICSSLAANGYDVLLVGRQMPGSVPLTNRAFRQHRLSMFFSKGKLFYVEYNIRLFFFLLFTRMDLVCAIDLDSILPCLFVSKLRGKKRVYDAHELFCEMKEIVSRPFIYRVWKAIERFTVPKFTHGYTVNEPIAEEFRKMYGSKYSVVRNIPPLRDQVIIEKKEKFILYQGAVNEGRSFETLIPAMKWVDLPLVIVGDGNFLEQAKELVKRHGLVEKVLFKGKMKPEELNNFTGQAYIGITLFENKGLSNYYSLANRFFDYIHAGVPQLCVDYPVYRNINATSPVALLVDDLSPENIAAKLNNLVNNSVLYAELRDNCLIRRKELNWQQEEQVLIRFYKALFEI